MDLIIAIIISGLISGFVIWIVSTLNLGLEVDGFLSAFIAAFVIAIVAGLVSWLLGFIGFEPGGGWLGAIVSLVIAAIVLMFSGGILPGLRVAGFTGALVAAISIAVVNWVIVWVLSQFL